MFGPDFLIAAKLSFSEFNNDFTTVVKVSLPQSEKWFLFETKILVNKSLYKL